MASTLYDPGREGFLDGSIDWDTATIKISLVRGYTFSATHKYVSQIAGAGGTIVATQTLTGKTVTNGVADANDLTFPLVPSGAAITSIVIYQASAVGGGADVATTQQRLIAFIDTAANLPLVPNGGNVDLVLDGGANKLFKL